MALNEVWVQLRSKYAKEKLKSLVVGRPYEDQLVRGAVESLAKDLQVIEEIAAGRLVIPANPRHCAGRLDPVGIGRALRTKINANIGVSAVSSDAPAELAKLCVAAKFGADTVMDLSVGSDLDASPAAAG